MSVKKFKFISPGIFLSEVDNSQLPADTPALGPIIIGRSQLGPAMRPIKVDSFSEFVQTFGNPVPGKAGGDIWRNGNLGGPTYGPYAAQAYLKPQIGPITYFRLLGAQAESPGTNGEAGWDTAVVGGGDGGPSPTIGSNGGAYGLFICQNSASLPSPGSAEGYLAAIFYVETGAVILTGSLATTSSAAPAFAAGGTCGLWNPLVGGTNFEYKASILDGVGNVRYTTAFNFDENSAKYIRNVFNTNPQLTNQDVVSDAGFNQGEQFYWLGESYSSWIMDKAALTSSVGGIDPSNAYATLLPLENSSGVNRADNRVPFAYAKTGHFIAQDLSTNTGSFLPNEMQKLFHFEALDGGRWVQDNLKISIQGIRYSRDPIGGNPYGSFSVLIRQTSDNDNVVQVVERFSNVNLNPTSPDYIGRKIGDKHMSWDYTELRLREYGEYNNQSKYIRVIVDENVANGVTDPRYLPFGVYGPPKFIGCTVESGSSSCTIGWVDGGDMSYAGVTGSLAGGISTGSLAGSAYEGIPSYSASLNFPDVAVRHTASDGGIANPTDAYFGLQTSLQLQLTGRKLYDPGYVDYLWPAPDGMTFPNDLLTEQWIFTLDDVNPITGSTTPPPVINATWASGSRRLGNSFTAGAAATSGFSGSYQAVLDAGYDRFTAPLWGGFDGLDITELEPFNNVDLKDQTNPNLNYAYYTVKRAIDSVADPEFVECNLMSIPGVTEETLTEHLINTCEDRGDALAVIDIPEDYEPFTESKKPFSERIGKVSTAVSNLSQRGINSSYGCTYYPWVQIRDTISGNLLWAPPSVVALGTFASSEATSELWFAPAGFNRGGLTEGSAGLPVLGVTQRLTSKDRDALYEVNINPIASFPSEGIVVFGQKTLQTTQSALDRINVRRLMVYIKKQVSQIAATILFDQNVQVTWSRFLGDVNPFLASVQSRLGLTEFRVILDDTTTTPDLVDRNILYAKIFLKPARAIEFIAIDFVITRTGASFED